MTSCAAHLAARPQSQDGMYPVFTASGAEVNLYCDMTNGGWTRVFSNPFKFNHAGVNLGMDCACGEDSGINNGAAAHSQSGWHLGVTQCHNTNGLSDVISGSSRSYSWRMDFNIVDLGLVSGVRHKGTNQNDHSYDYVSSWPAGAELTSRDHLASNGEFMSAYRDESGEWNFFARYNLGDFDVREACLGGGSCQKASHPYFTFLYSGGGPSGCDEHNSDGFDILDYEIYVK